MQITRPESTQPIPEGGKMVFKWKLFDVYQWEQVMYDGTTSTFEKLKRPDTVLVIGVLEDGRILLTKEQQPGKNHTSIGLPGGRMEEWEDPLLAAQREFLEETGYESDEWSLWKSIHPTTKLDWVIYTFVARNCRKTSDPHLDGGEKIEVQIVTFDELLKMASEDDFLEKDVAMELLRAQCNPEKDREIKRIFGLV